MTDLQSTPTVERSLEQHRTELTGYCYRMLGSTFEAEDAVQETMVRAWKSIDRFEGRAALRSWLYRIATNVCLDMLNGRQRRARPMDLGPAGVGRRRVPRRHAARGRLARADARLARPAEDGDPAELAASRETLRLAFVNALQHLPPRQRAVLILREVLRWQASEVAELLDTSVASVNSALQRARAQLADNDLTPDTPVDPLDDGQRELLDRYVAAFEQYDMDALTSLLQEDATLSMPPFDCGSRAPTRSGHGSSATASTARARACSRSTPTAPPASRSTGRARTAAGSRGRSRCWRSQTGGSPISTRSSTPQRFFPLFGLPARLDA